MKIFNVPIESLEERYSAQWNKWFPEQFNLHGIAYETIYPDTLTDKIKDGSFLDVCGTNYFKAGQLKILTEKLYHREIKDGDVVFFHDLWFPGIEMLQYIRQGIGLKFKICGILHAGTYDPYDFLSKKGMGSWGEHIENAWFDFIDEIYVATEFHKFLLTKRMIDRNKIIVTGLPIYFDRPVCWSQKENIVVFPHRLDSEKQPELFDKLANEFKNSGWQFIKSKDVCKTKKEYLNLLHQSKIAVSFAKQETWGIAQQEALFAGCFPVVPNRLSYQEMYSERFQYNSFSDAVLLVAKLMRPSEEDYVVLELNKTKPRLSGSLAIPRMINLMMTLGAEE